MIDKHVIKYIYDSVCDFFWTNIRFGNEGKHAQVSGSQRGINSAKLVKQ